MKDSLSLHRAGFGSEDALFHPAEQRSIEIEWILSGDVWHHGSALPLIHQMPHRRDREFPAALICWHGFVGYEVEDTAAKSETSLLDLVLAHALLVVWDEDRGPKARWYNVLVRTASALGL
jgi:hypothetical protein